MLENQPRNLGATVVLPELMHLTYCPGQFVGRVSARDVTTATRTCGPHSRLRVAGTGQPRADGQDRNGPTESRRSVGRY